MKKVTLKGIKRSWSEVISRLEKSSSKVAHFLEDAKVHSFDGEQVLIGLMNGHKFHLKTLEKDAKLIEEEMNDILGQEINIKFHLQDDPEERKVKAKHSKGERMKNNSKELLVRAQSMITELSKELEEKSGEFAEYKEMAENKIDFYDRFSESESTIDFSKAAKLLGYDDFGRGKLFAFCREQGYLRYRPGTPAHNEPYQRYMSLFEVKMQPYTANGKEHMGTKTVFTQKGFKHIRKVLDECNNYE